MYQVMLTADPASSSHTLFGACSYGELESKGATIVWGDFSEGVGKLVPEGESFDYVFDNYAKDVDTCKNLADCAKAWCVPTWYLEYLGCGRQTAKVHLYFAEMVAECCANGARLHHMSADVAVVAGWRFANGSLYIKHAPDSA